MTDEELVKRADTAWHDFRRVELYRGDPEREAAMKDELVNYIPHLVGAAQRLLAEVEQLREIARALAHTPPAYREQPEEWYCIHCGANFIPSMGRGNEYDESVAYRMLRHSVACPVTKARALLEDTKNGG